MEREKAKSKEQSWAKVRERGTRRERLWAKCKRGKTQIAVMQHVRHLKHAGRWGSYQTSHVRTRTHKQLELNQAGKKLYIRTCCCGTCSSAYLHLFDFIQHQPAFHSLLQMSQQYDPTHVQYFNSKYWFIWCGPSDYCDVCNPSTI